MSDAADRVIPATPRRREAARRAGMMPAAAVPAWAAAAATALALLPAWGRATLPAAADMLRHAIRAGVAPATAPDLATLAPAPLVLPTLGLVLASAAAALAVRFLCDGVSWQPDRVAPDLRRIDLLAGLRRIFSPATLAAILGNGLGLALLVGAAIMACGPLAAVVAGPGDPAVAPRAWAAARHTLLAIAAAAAGVAACQWGLARLRFERRIRMTPQEFADEAKSMQADPKVRLLQRQQPRRAA